MSARAKAAELVARLVAIDSVNPALVPGAAGEREIAAFVAAWLAERGLEVELDEPAPGRANVVARVRGRGGGRSLLLNGHLDTVAVGGPDAGHRPRVEDGRLYGRGSYDMKGGLAAIMLAAAAASGMELAGDVILAAVADEEAESIGSARVAATVSADAAIVAEPTELRAGIAHRGFVWLEVATEGRAAHGSRYDLGVDAIAAMGRPLSALPELDRRLRSGREPHPLLGFASLHASLIEGGQDLASYPARCLLKVERRTLPGESAARVEAELAAAVAPASVRTLLAREPLEVAPGEPVLEALLAAARGRGLEPELAGMPFWTDAAIYAGAGIPAVLFGPGGEGAHGASEWVRVADVELTAAILADTAAAFCG